MADIWLKYEYYSKLQKNVITEFFNCIFRKNEANVSKTPPVEYTESLKMLKKNSKDWERWQLLWSRALLQQYCHGQGR